MADTSNMRQVIMDFPKQLEVGFKLAKNVKVKGKFKNIVIAGVGGSALPADLLVGMFHIALPIYIHKDYNLPREASRDSLVICISYSGNTEETISVLQEALTKKLPVIGIATGGEIEKLCQENKITFVKIPSGIQPRSAVGYLFSVLAGILANHNAIEDISGDLKNTVKDLQAIKGQLEKEGKVLAEKLVKKVPIIYASRQYQALAEIWKIRFNENSKIPAFYNYFPELNHNELVGFSEVEKVDAKFYAIFLQDQTDHPRIAKRMELTAETLQSKNIPVSIIASTKGSETSKIFSSLMLSDWTSYHLALLNDVDPTPVAMIEDFKKRLLQ